MAGASFVGASTSNARFDGADLRHVHGLNVAVPATTA
jgi:hypothetical protein